MWFVPVAAELRGITLKIKWRFDLAKCKIYYIHRGAPRGEKIAEGSIIKNIERSFLVLEGDFEDIYIPYHRIFRIEFEDQIIFEKIRERQKDQEFKL